MKWEPDFKSSSSVFRVLDGLWEESTRAISSGWPSLEELCALLEGRAHRAVSEAGAPIQFVSQGPKVRTFEGHYEVRIYEQGEVQTRLEDWHDFFNALTWALFPRAKAAINARHYEELVKVKDDLYTRPKRSFLEHVLSLFNESGIVVVCADPALRECLQEFSWKELFWERRKRVSEAMGFFLFGHALYPKCMTPYLGLTGHSIIYDVPEEFFQMPLSAQIEQVDLLMASTFSPRSQIHSARDLVPFPLLGYPGIVEESEQPEYYDNKQYFRDKRREK